MLYFDTSALLPYYRREAHSLSVEALLTSLSEPVLISALTRVEFASALARWVRWGELDERMANRVEGTFRQDQAAGRFRIHVLGGPEYERAYEWLIGRRTSLRTLDALHLACAQTADAALVSLDEALLRAADYLAVPIHRLT